MYKIKEIKLKNFKFFYGERSIDFDRKHILLYGENGSGKSSIYWALYTFFQSVFKTDVRQVQKYFLPTTRNEESLKSRYAEDDDDSYIEIHFENDPSDPRAKKISNTTVNTRTDKFIEEITLTSDLIDYKSIFNIYNFTNKSKVKLFAYFEKHLLPFIKLNTPLVKIDGSRGSQNSEVWWNYIKDGLDPYPGIYAPEYAAFQGLISTFNDDLESYLNTITETANSYLKDRFKEEFQIKFVYQKCTYNDFNTHNKGRNKTTIAPEIFLEATLIDENIDENSRNVSRIHTFLNEARLSSIALAIRMAILKEKFVRESPKILVLDDLLLSLDMGNREAVLSIVLEEYLKDYQLIILTHDKVFFHSALSYIKVKYATELKKTGETDTSVLETAFQGSWKVFELYESTLPDGKKIPSIAEHKSYLQKAYHYFNNQDNIDYNACGNNLRSALEERLRTIIPSRFLRQADGHPLPTTSLTLGTLLTKGIDFFNHIGFDISLFERLDRYRERALNQTSHYNPKSNYFKRELQDTFEIINELDRYKFEPMIMADQTLQLSISSTKGTEHLYTFKLLDEVKLYLQPKEGTTSFYSPNDKYTVALVGCTSSGTSDLLAHVAQNLTLDEFYDETISGLQKITGEDYERSANVFSIIKTLDGKTLDELKAY
jgi:energy-coupling factor transporter ATP-binding protein EcfA2